MEVMMLRVTGGLTLNERPKSLIAFRKSVILGRKLGIRRFRLGGFPSNSGSNSFIKTMSDRRITVQPLANL